jgi:hypothetical protein
MAKQPKAKVGSDPTSTLQVPGSIDPNASPRLLAQLAIAPSLQAASTIKLWSHAIGELDIVSLVEELRQQATTASGGNLKRHEAMLTMQAHTLDTIFNELARRSSANIGEYLDAAERFMRLALKAQSQCRATIETLAEMKNPKPVAFVQQANIAHGAQQVNNGGSVAAKPSRAGDSETQQSKLLEVHNGERLDIGTTGQTVGSDPAMATVGTFDRTANG